MRILLALAVLLAIPVAVAVCCCWVAALQWWAARRGGEDAGERDVPGQEECHVCAHLWAMYSERLSEQYAAVNSLQGADFRQEDVTVDALIADLRKAAEERARLRDAIHLHEVTAHRHSAV